MSTKPLTNFEFAWQYLKTETGAFLLAILFVIINALLQLLTPWSIEFLINNAIKVPNNTLLLQVIGVMCILFLVEGGIFRTQVRTVGYAAQRIMLKIRTKLFGHIQELPTEYFGQNKSGDLISRINSDTTLIDNFLGQYIFQFSSSFFVFLAFGVYLFVLNSTLALVAYLGVIITIVISYSSGSIGKRINKKALSSNGEIKSYLADNLNNYQVIEAYNIHKSLVTNFESFNKNNQEVNFWGRIFINIFSSIYNFAGNLAVLLVMIAILYFGLGNDQTYIGTLVAFLYATIKFFGPLRELGNVFGSLSEVQAALNRIREILNEKVNDVFAKSGSVSKTNTNSTIAIEFSYVSFTYPNTDNVVVDKISFEVATNSKFAIIGPTGEGKSTIAKLISGLLSPNQGTIKIFGSELVDWTQNDFYNTIGFILQDPFLFSGTVASNIIYGNQNYTHFNLIKTSQNPESALNELVAKLSQDIKDHELESIIPNLDEFLRTEVNNNSQNISQGQKQIINFVRVLLREPKILILDEATANLDTITEQYLQNALDKLTNKVTQIIIAHRQNTIKNCDKIMLVSGGKVEVKGN
jgi:ATP-binding cassette, subfamily B, bacterial